MNFWRKVTLTFSIFKDFGLKWYLIFDIELTMNEIYRLESPLSKFESVAKLIF